MTSLGRFYLIAILVFLYTPHPRDDGDGLQCLAAL